MDLEDKFLAKGTVLIYPYIFLFSYKFLLSLCYLFNSWYNRWLAVEKNKRGWSSLMMFYDTGVLYLNVMLLFEA
jgi:hypothetical protein